LILPDVMEANDRSGQKFAIIYQGLRWKFHPCSNFFRSDEKSGYSIVRDADFELLPPQLLLKRCATVNIEKLNPNMVSQLSQDPHRTRENEREKVLEVAIGREVRAYRRQQEVTVAELSSMTGISIGMLSKIENGNTSPSLTTLQSLANALSVPLTSFFRQFEETRQAVHTPAGEGVEIKRDGTRANHQYNLLGHIGSNASGVIVEPYLITLTAKSDVFPTFQHGGIETIYMLEGEVDYRHGDTVYPLKPGDTLFFDADAPHGPEKLVKLPSRYLSIISYPQNT
jgi:transcriptional regulator with XRE-family HTH domain